MHIWLVVSTPLKNISQFGLLFPIYGKIKHVPNHQPDNHSSDDWWFETLLTGVWLVVVNIRFTTHRCTFLFDIVLIRIIPNIWENQTCSSHHQPVV